MTNQDKQKTFEVELALDGIKLTKIPKADRECLIPISEFKENCEDHTVMDSDGVGYYAIENGYSLLYAYPSDFMNGFYESNFKEDQWTHVLWYNK